MEKFPALKCLKNRPFPFLFVVLVIFTSCAFYLYIFHNYKISNFVPLESNSDLDYDPSLSSSIGVFRRNYLRNFDTVAKKDNQSEEKNLLAPDINKQSFQKLEAPSETKYVYIHANSTLLPTLRTTTVHSRTTSKSWPETCPISATHDTKLILLWTSFFDVWDYFPRSLFRSCPLCPNCRTTKDRTLLKQSDAVIFHARDMSLADLPTVRYPHQRWVFFCLESPLYSDFPGLAFMHDMFNWTMTYRSDSDIVTRYGTLHKRYPSRKLDLESMENLWHNKTKNVVWLSSHCPTEGGRDDYVAELEKYIDVDVYGRCGKYTCPKNETSKCFRQFSATYKFFLAFENSICKDYVTEKFFRTLKYNLVPVVFGAGSAYRNFAPPGSYIDALSFKSPKHLAFFLSGLSKDFKHYSSYFRWREDYTVEMFSKKECDLCHLLHKDTMPSSYSNLRKWWVQDAKCWTWYPKR